MENRKMAGIFIKASLISLIMASVTICLVPFASGRADVGKPMAGYILAAVFWLGSIAGYVCLWLCKKRVQAPKEGKGVPLCINIYGSVANAVFAVSILLYLISQVVFKWNVVWGYGCIFLILLSFHMSVLCNSRTFTYIMNLTDRRVKKDEG